MLRVVTRRLEKTFIRPFRKPKPKPPPQQPPPPPPPEPPPSEPPPLPPEPPPPVSDAVMSSVPSAPFLFPRAASTVLPDPSPFFSPELLRSPLPTNCFFQNFALNDGSQQEYIHPYLIKPSSGDGRSLSICNPAQFSNSAFLYQVFNADLTVSADQGESYSSSRHVITAFDDLSVTLDFPSSGLRFWLVRGSPYVTCSVHRSTGISISTIHAVISLTPNSSRTKHVIRLNNGQTWIVYSSSPISFRQVEVSAISSDRFSGVLRVAALPEGGDVAVSEEVLDRFSSCYPVSGEAVFSRPFCMEYRFEKRGWGDLLILAHPLHLKMLSQDDCSVTVLEGFKYRSIDGDLIGVVGDNWLLKPDPVSITWHSIKGVNEEAFSEIISALCKDVEGLSSAGATTTSSYFYGKLIARAARLALIAEEVSFPDVIPTVRKFLKDKIEPWLVGSFSGNGFLYDEKWGGIMTKQGLVDAGADFGFGLYNDHHYHLGYFVYAIAVLAKIDPAWGRKYRPQAYSLMADFMSLGRKKRSLYTRLRCFDLYKLHSWAGGLTEFADGRNQESTSEAVNAYYSAALMGLAYGDAHLVAVGSLIASMEIQAAEMWWHVRERDGLYGEEFTRENRVVGVLWANKRDSGLWFAAPDRRECRLGIQVLPLLPITETLFSDDEFTGQLVRWTYPAISKEGVEDGWKGFVYAMEGIYDRDSALHKVRSLSGFDDGNSLSNLLWWIHSRGHNDEAGCKGRGKFCWFGHYCH